MPVRPLVPLALVAALVGGCALSKAPTSAAAVAPHATSVPPAPAAAKPAPVAVTRFQVPSDPSVSLPAGVLDALSSRVISNDGGSVISNDGGSVISNDGGSVISNDGGSLVATGAGNATGARPFGLLETAFTKEDYAANFALNMIDLYSAELPSIKGLLALANLDQVVGAIASGKGATLDGGQLAVGGQPIALSAKAKVALTEFALVTGLDQPLSLALVKAEPPKASVLDVQVGQAPLLHVEFTDARHGKLLFRATKALFPNAPGDYYLATAFDRDANAANVDIFQGMGDSAKLRLHLDIARPGSGKPGASLGLHAQVASLGSQAFADGLTAATAYSLPDGRVATILGQRSKYDATGAVQLSSRSDDSGSHGFFIDAHGKPAPAADQALTAIVPADTDLGKAILEDVSTYDVTKDPLFQFAPAP